MRRVLFAIPTMDVVGTQRLLPWILKGLDRRRFEPVLLLHERTGAFLSEVPTDVRVEVVSSALDHALPRRLRLVTWLSGYVRQVKRLRPDVALGMSEYPTMALAFAARVTGHRMAIIATEHVFMSRAIDDPSAFSFLFRHYFRRRFPGVYNNECRLVTTETQAAAEDLAVNWGIHRSKLRAIPNPIDYESVRSRSQGPVDHPWFSTGRPVVIAVGRLVQQKRFDRLIAAFAAMRRRDALLMIVGYGPLANDLRARASHAGIGDRFEILQRAPAYDYVARSAVYALTSEWEGFGMAILDAMVLGVPVVCTDCPAGPPELLKGGQLGQLIPENDIEGFAMALERAINREPDVARKAAEAQVAARRYDLSTVCAEYDALIEESLTPPAGMGTSS